MPVHLFTMGDSHITTYGPHSPYFDIRGYLVSLKSKTKENTTTIKPDKLHVFK